MSNDDIITGYLLGCWVGQYAVFSIDISTVNLALSLSLIINKLVVHRYWHIWKKGTLQSFSQNFPKQMSKSKKNLSSIFSSFFSCYINFHNNFQTFQYFSDFVLSFWVLAKNKNTGTRLLGSHFFSLLILLGGCSNVCQFISLSEVVKLNIGSLHRRLQTLDIEFY